MRHPIRRHGPDFCSSESDRLYHVCMSGSREMSSARTAWTRRVAKLFSKLNRRLIVHDGSPRPRDTFELEGVLPHRS